MEKYKIYYELMQKISKAIKEAEEQIEKGYWKKEKVAHRNL
jgi:hypothetical protein